jgi:hypothetical protein
MAKTIRFSELLKKAGRPFAATLWTNPNDDPALRKAIQENRVLTVKQETVGHKKDFGRIGFIREENVGYFIFPKKLLRPSDLLVVGIKYELLGQPKTSAPVSNQARTKPEQKKQTEKEFVARIQRVAVWNDSIRVQAKTKTEAKQKAATILAKKKFPDSEATTRNEVRSVREV